MRFVIVAFLLVFLANSLLSQIVPEQWLTSYEKSGYIKTPRYAETMEYCRKLEKASPWIKVVSIGKSPEGRDIQLVIASKEKAFDPKKAAKSGKAVLLIQNGIHAGEIDGKDACLMLLRDIAITKSQASLLDHVILLVIPIFNVDGHERFGPFNRINQNGPEEMGWRVTAQNLNLNRDYMKADSPELQAWLKLFTAWLPDFFVDCHVTDGADFQHIVSYGIETHMSVSAPVRGWIRDKYLPAISHLTTNGIPVIPYVFLKDEKDPLKGLLGGTAPPRFSTNYTPLQNRPGLLIETHMLKSYKQRVDGTYQMLEATMKLLNVEYASLRDAVQRADEQTVQSVKRPFPLQFETTEHANQTVHFMGFTQNNVESDISGGTRIVYTKQPFEADVPRYDSIEVTKSVQPPVAYLIPPQWQTVIERLKLHGLKLDRLTSPADLLVESYRFSNVKWQQTPYEGRHPVTYSVASSVEKRTFPVGTVVLPMNQRAARVALHLLEPDAPDAFVAWGFFDAIFEQKEYAEDYVMETMAREMIEKDPKLKAELELKMRTDSTLTTDPNRRLNFFYERSPYWDSHINLYPVARLLQAVPIQSEPLR